MRKIIITLSLLFQLTCHAQSRVVYTYDGNGNRILRSMITESNQPRHSRATDINTDYVKDIIIKENGSTVSISCPDILYPLEISIYSITGIKIDDYTIKENNQKINLSHYQTGIYVVSISSKNSVIESRKITIIK